MKSWHEFRAVGRERVYGKGDAGQAARYAGMLAERWGAEVALHVLTPGEAAGFGLESRTRGVDLAAELGDGEEAPGWPR